MCVGVTVLLGPPTVLGTGYLCWYAGHRHVLDKYYIDRDEPPSDSISSYTVGLLALGSTYYIQSLFIFPLFEGRNSSPSSSGSSASETKPMTSMDEFKKHAFARKHTFPTTTTTSKSSTSSSYSTPTKGSNTSTSYVPPSSISELAIRIAPAIILRVCATSIAFYCAGVIQTYVAAKFNTNHIDNYYKDGERKK